MGKKMKRISSSRKKNGKNNSKRKKEERGGKKRIQSFNKNLIKRKLRKIFFEKDYSFIIIIFFLL